MTTNCGDLSEEVVFAALYNNAKPQGMGMMVFKSKEMSVSDAQEILKTTRSFDYHKGRVMKIGFQDYPILSTRGYDRDNQRGVEEIIQELKSSGQCTPGIASTIKELTEEEKANLATDHPSLSFVKVHDYGGKTIEQIETEYGKKVVQFTKIYFTDTFIEEEIKDSIPYPREWFMFMGDHDDTHYKYAGSCGGGIGVNKNTNCIKSASFGFL
jgi:hypothetical protein